MKDQRSRPWRVLWAFVLAPLVSLVLAHCGVEGNPFYLAFDPTSRLQDASDVGEAMTFTDAVSLDASKDAGVDAEDVAATIDVVTDDGIVVFDQPDSIVMIPDATADDSLDAPPAMADVEETGSDAIAMMDVEEVGQDVVNDRVEQDRVERDLVENDRVDLDAVEAPVDSPPACSTGERLCGMVCRAIGNDLMNCGACDQVCVARTNAVPICTSGACGIVCTPGFGDCDSNAANGCEAPLISNAHCGRCGNACAIGMRCSNGSCVISCPTGTTFCESVNLCVNTQSDTGHCGACDRACQAFANSTVACATGRCRSTCDAGFGDCDGNAANGCETVLTTAVDHCGACGNRCALSNATNGCTANACTIQSCNANFGNCDSNVANGCETDFRTAVSHCGACGAACPVRANAATVCTSGVCGFTCTTGFGDCDGNAANGCETDLRTTATHCGTCGNVCSSGVCSGGLCPDLVVEYVRQSGNNNVPPPPELVSLIGASFFIGGAWAPQRLPASVIHSNYFRSFITRLAPDQRRATQVTLSLPNEGCGNRRERACPLDWNVHWRVHWLGRDYSASTFVTRGDAAAIPAIQMDNLGNCAAQGFPDVGCVLFNVP